MLRETNTQTHPQIACSFEHKSLARSCERKRESEVQVNVNRNKETGRKDIHTHTDTQTHRHTHTHTHTHEKTHQWLVQKLEAAGATRPLCGTCV
jgi:hypothetical protein